ncbi:hypothetical protein Tco_0310483, partial [Tanacetum coccineum]
MYPRFLQTILGIQTDDTTHKAIRRFSSKMFTNIKLKFAGEPMPLLAAMLPGGPMDGGAANAVDATIMPQPTSPLVEPQPVSTSSPVRQPTPNPTNPFPFMEDDFSGGDYYVSPTRSNDAPPTTSQSAGGAEEP